MYDGSPVKELYGLPLNDATKSLKFCSWAFIVATGPTPLKNHGPCGKKRGRKGVRKKRCQEELLGPDNSS